MDSEGHQGMSNRYTIGHNNETTEGHNPNLMQRTFGGRWKGFGTWIFAEQGDEYGYGADLKRVQTATLGKVSHRRRSIVLVGTGRVMGKWCHGRRV